jgi:hypothetical protein
MKVFKDSALLACFAMPLVCACRASGAASDATEHAPATSPTQPTTLPARPLPALDEWSACVRLATPGAYHHALDPLVGRFKARVLSRPEPGAEPEETAGTVHNHWILGGRFLQSDFEGRAIGMPFEGVGILGFDNARRRYVATWIENTSTAIMPVMEGAADDSGKRIAVAGSMDDELTQQPVHVRQVWSIESDDRHRFEMWTTDANGVEFEALEIVFTRT